MDIEKIKKLNIPKNSGCYLYKNKSGEILYIGKASNLNSRVRSYWQKSTNHTPAKHSMVKQVKNIEILETDSEIEALLLEANLIKKHMPPYNVDRKDDKRFLYVKISVDDEIPTVRATRKIDKSGRYFGPYISASAVRETLRAIRKIWPYCTQKKIANKLCFYYQINRCLGICGGIVEKKEYIEKVIKPIIMFFEGRKDKIIKNMKRKKTTLLKSGDEEAAAKIEYYLNNMKHVLEHANIISLSEKYSADVIELSKLLTLSKIPERIEGYDISNIFGKDAVGSMVVFSDGEANKSEYKKFKIKIGEGIANDVGMLKEVITRRFGNDWPLPDLIIVDGGKAQRNAVMSILKKKDIDIPVLAVSKGQGLRSAKAPDKIFFPGEKEALELPLASPALHIIKRVRDEAHRFAVSYHKILRKKRTFK